MLKGENLWAIHPKILPNHQVFQNLFSSESSRNSIKKFYILKMFLVVYSYSE